MKNTDLYEVYDRVRSFLTKDVWSADTSQFPRFRAVLYRVVRFFEQVITGFSKDQCLLRASALTYSSMLSLVPCMAIMFAVLKGLGVQKRLEPFIFDKITPVSPDAASAIMEYIDRINVGSLGVFGVITLLATVLLVIKNMERSFNQIWNVRKGRTLFRTITDYSSILIIFPICILAALSLNTYVMSLTLYQKAEQMWVLGGFVRTMLKASPFLIMWIVFTFCYMFMPNARVNIISAGIGGILGGTVLQLAQKAYIHYQIGVFKYNAIYGALAQLPILIVWIYVSWVIVLIGAEIAAAHQYAKRYYGEKILNILSDRSPVGRLLEILKTVCERFLNGSDPYQVKELRETIRMPEVVLEDSLSKLVRLEWLAPLNHKEAYILFRKPPDRMLLHRVFEEISTGRVEKEGREESNGFGGIVSKVNKGVESALAGMTVMDLVDMQTYSLENDRSKNERPDDDRPEN